MYVYFTRDFFHLSHIFTGIQMQGYLWRAFVGVSGLAKLIRIVYG